MHITISALFSQRLLRRGAAALALTLPLTMVSACGTSEASDGSIGITFSTAASEQQAGDWIWLSKEVEKRTGGRVTFRSYFNGTLVGAPDTLKAVQDGRADAGWVSPTYQPADFPVWSVNQLQYISDNPEAVSRAVQAEYAEGSLLTRDFEDSGVKAIGFVTYGPNVVGTAKPLSSINDLKGLVMRSAGTSDYIMKAAGARPTTMGVNEVYESLERGTIEGFTQLPFATAAKVGLSEVTPYLTDIGSGAYSSAAFVMREATWNKLPDDVKKVFQQVAGELVSQYFVVQNGYDKEACESYKKNGTQLSRLPENEISELRDRSLNSLVGKWKQAAVAAGFATAELDDYYESYTSKIKAAEPSATTYKNPFEACS